LCFSSAFVVRCWDSAFRKTTIASFHIFSIHHSQTILLGCLGGAVVSVLATGPKGHRFIPSQGDGLSRAIKFCSTPSFRWEVKPEVPCHKILQHVKDPLRYLRY
jgi:hypothetical protein